MNTNGGGIILYDGVCVLCNRLVRFVVRRDPQGYFAFAQLQSQAGNEIRDICGRTPLHSNTIVVMEEGKCYERSEAVFRILRRLRFPWNVLPVFRILPSRLSDAVYRFIAQNRYRIFGRYDQCPMPSPEISERSIS
ncbi:MAG: thiol-disulfide oxidoreductase DCC family protein [Ignavibacteria bacterium]|nr:thiol-disulfide oxidoreductase DCC family protein [Ignavibacteria bacterium]